MIGDQDLINIGQAIITQIIETQILLQELMIQKNLIEFPYYFRSASVIITPK